ncbi:cytochrome-c oxidase [Paenibacillus filicis]|uniref:Cytochrome-c oxidase n=1 Tax=Paenibacillus gyeongsangnamensis TaxID=3388067 RepID=A0ABT4QBA3_9BACL|nr:cytochrome-c oxidase [Paenibacillus filicis]MCZ8514174.1 cytochrome-c oxidase [Paenibacillus filicis]
MGPRLVKIASCYFIIGVFFGMFMSITHHMEFASVHAHLNLVGWVSMALAGLIYSVFSKAGASKLAVWHFWCHNIGLPIMMIALALLVGGAGNTEPIIAVGGIITTLAVILFVINVFKHVSLPSSPVDQEKAYRAKN